MICCALGMMKLLQSTSPIDRKMGPSLPLGHFVTNWSRLSHTSLNLSEC